MTAPLRILTLVLVCLYLAHGAPTTASTGCGTVPADIQFLLDDSGSIGSDNFQTMKDYVSTFAQSFDIGPNNAQIGVTTFSNDVHNQFNLNDYHSKTALLSAIQSVPYHTGGTNTFKGLTYVETNSFTKAAGDRDHVANILIVMTDGKSNNKTKTVAAANRLHSDPKNIKVICIGIGDLLDLNELQHIATDTEHVFTVTHFDALHTVQSELKKTACEIDGGWSEWAVWSPCTKSCGGRTQSRLRYCDNPPPANGGNDCNGTVYEQGICNVQTCPNTHNATYTTDGCVHGGHIYNVGESWYDVSNHNCTCVDGFSGVYVCDHLYVPMPQIADRSEIQQVEEEDETADG